MTDKPETTLKRKPSKAKARRVRQWREGALAQLARIKVAKETESAKNAD